MWSPEQVRRVWHQNTDMERYVDQGPRVIVSARGATLRDSGNRDYIDALGSHNTCSVGHGRSEIIEAIAQQLRQLDFCALHLLSHEPALALAERMTALAPGELECVYYGTSGTESNETAIKLARGFFQRSGQSSRIKIIGRRGSYHGNTLGAIAAGGVRRYRHAAGPLPQGFIQIPAAHTFSTGEDAAVALEETILFEGPETCAAMIAEPIALTEGVSFPPERYFACVAEICRRYGILLIADEVICGMGRTGSLFASEQLGLIPDMLTLGKALSGGYFPISALLIHGRIREAFAGQAFAHFSTYGGHPAGCAAALAVFDIIEREQLVQRSRAIGSEVVRRLKSLEEFSIVRRVEGRGLLIGIELIESAVPTDLETLAMDLGLFCGSRGLWILLAPPLSISPEETDQLIERVTKLVEMLAGRAA